MARGSYMQIMARIYAPNRIREQRKRRGMTMEELGAAVRPEVTLGTIAKLETGQMGLTLDYINEIARVLEVSPFDLIVGDRLQPVRFIPLVGEIAAGNWAEAVEISDEVIPVPEYVGGTRAFALRPRGESMNRIVPDGGFIVVDPDQIELLDGRSYAVRNGNGETTFKTFRANPPRLEPCSTDPRYATIMVGAEPFIVIGRVTYAGSEL